MRVVAGTHRGRRIAAPKGDATRPTSDRVREGAFSSISSMMGPLEGMRVLDMYAGSGALGIESLSRGASGAVFLESARSAIKVLKHNLKELDLDARGTVVGVPVGSAVALIPRGDQFSLLFADPPYRINKSEVRSAIEALIGNDMIAADALFVWEHATGENPEWPMGFEQSATKRYGSTTLSYARYNPIEEV